ncbi:hypothetical protein WQ54_02160 [Bacillus sp. SA1-12]|uniref:fluoride efflux transporter FluC n=1 Tax=Bacillus sp. SA1-12 TaxID=1455638 RepID=UPI000624FED6|nr:CrcB family protein [Bacillus sp. SA1-12]KKI93873.1 hypothetical protein WQ54_02160 [Bacillus sp. SA1-12]
MKRKLLNSGYVAAGGAIGSLLRYIVLIIVPYGPLPTLLVNITGSFLLGWLTSLLFKRFKKEWLRCLLGTGFCGGFTTMSTFSFELTRLGFLQAIFYGSCSIIMGLFAALLGLKAGKGLETKSW